MKANESHSKLNRGGYTCPRCSSKVCALPIECPVCGLTLILSTHLARSYHHLFPLRNWPELPYSEYLPFANILTQKHQINTLLWMPNAISTIEKASEKDEQYHK